MAEVNKSQAIRDHFKSNPKATAQEVVDALASHGITVTTGLVRTIKFTHNQRHTAKKAAKTAAASEATTNGVSKTQAVKDYLKEHRTASRNEVVEALAAQGITITANYVGTIKAKSKKRRRAVKQVVENVVAEGGVGVPEIKAAFAFLKAVGSVEIAKQALAAALEIKKVV